MTYTIPPNLPPAFSRGSSSSRTQDKLTPQDFTTLLLAQMRMPDISSFGLTPEESATTSPFGAAFSPTQQASIFGNQSLFGGATQGVSPIQNFASLYSGFSPQMELSIWSNLIGKTVEAVDSTGKKIRGKVQSIQLESGKAMLNIDGNLASPDTLTKVE